MFPVQEETFQMSKKDFVKVRILDYPGLSTGCSCCGPSTCGPEYYSNLKKGSELREALEAAYPGRTSLEYVDLIISPEERSSDAGQLLESRQYPSPLVVIDGQPRFAGSIQINRIVNEVGKVLNSPE
jgi:disulfide oxidoreductase YuzD